MLDQAKVDTERHLYEREYWIKVTTRFVDAKRTWDCIVEIARADSQDPEIGLERAEVESQGVARQRVAAGGH